MAQSLVHGPENSRTVRRATARMVAAWIILPLLFLVTGGSLEWWEAWTFCALILIPMTFFVRWMARRDPSFFDRRLKVSETERAQRRIQAWGTPFILAAYVLPGLDRRFGWSELPLTVVALAMVAVAGSYLAILRVFMENRWAGRTIETTTDQEVVTTGPYAVVRHPMYAGFILMSLAMPLALGSWWAVLPAIATIPIMVLRIRNEEEVLARELRGYDAYRRSVRYRLVPGVW